MCAIASPQGSMLCRTKIGVTGVIRETLARGHKAV
jgi:hypothetical protein